MKNTNTITSLISTEQHRLLNFQVNKQVPPNKLLTPQRPFISTRKKQAKSTTRITKPDFSDKQKMILSLTKNKPLYLSQQELLRKLK